MVEAVEASQPEIQREGKPPSRGRLKRMALWFRSSFHWWLLLIPVAYCFTVYELSERKIWIFEERHLAKDVLEVAHPIVLAVVFLVAYQGWRLTREYRSGWLTILAALFFMRELHYSGTGIIFFLGILLLFRAAYKNDPERELFLEDRLAASFLVMCVLCYITSQILDRGLAEEIVDLFRSGEPEVNFEHSSNIEEAIETLGGLFLLSTTLFMKRRR